MDKRTKLAIYLFLFGILTIFTVLFNPQTPTTFTQQEVLGLQSGAELYIQPEAKEKHLLDKLDSAQRQVLITIYMLSDPEIIAGIIETDQRGVEVKVILEEHPFGGSNLNRLVKPQLEQAGVEVIYASSDYPYTHQKSLIVDESTLCILNQNLTKSSFEENRDYNLCLTNPLDVQEAVDIFWADWEGRSYKLDPSNLVVSPESARGKLTTLLEGAEKSVDIEVEVMDDPKLLETIREVSKRVPVRLLLPDPQDIEVNMESAKQLEGGNVLVRYLLKPYLHAKLITIDDNRSYVGSVNLTTNSLDENRELGIIVSQSDIVGRLVTQFQEDWDNALEL